MSEGFFNVKQTQSVPYKTPDCKHCGLRRGAENPCMAASGKGEKKILVLAQSPGAEEDKQNTQLVGRAGQLTRGLLKRSGIDLENDCRRLNAVNCFPGDTKISPTHVKRCRPMVWDELRRNPPHLIIPMGTEAVMSILGHRYIGDSGGFKGITRWRGWTIPDQHLKAWVCPVLHPSYILRQGGRDDVSWRITSQDIDRAVDLLDKEVPDYGDEESKIEMLWTKKEIRRALRCFGALQTPAAFDFETTGLKPEREGHRILTCAVSDHGERAVSFPVEGVERPLADWIESSVPKVAANKKFETRWSRHCLGADPKNWCHDTMLYGHWLDNRPGVTSVKFQTCVYFGNPDYDSHMEPYKKGVDTAENAGNSFNRMHEIDAEKLLMYGGLDAMYEMRLYEKQKGMRP